MQTNHPPKEVVREYTDRRSREKSPPPTPDEIRRILGWHLIPNNGPVPEVPV
jgi:hypothetical protein